MSGLTHAHSGLRWLTLAILIFAVFNAILKRKKEYQDGDKTISIIALSLTHLQVVIGLVLYFAQSRQNGLSELGESDTRLYSLEHPLMMLIAAVLITIGHSKSKKAAESSKKFKFTYLFFGIGLVLILSRIPWPFLVQNAHWF
ncbi:MAG: cytochrome B [Flavobacteriales bacterium]|nr:cytochrome B [Flavobacteriales bacterium]